MPDYSLVPVDHQPDFSGFSLVPVDYDPFSADGVVQQAQTQTQPAQTGSETPPLQPATGVGQPDVVAPPVSAQTAAPAQPNPYPGEYPTSNCRYGPSIINAVQGMFNPSFDEDKKIVSGIYDAAKDAFLAPGRLMEPNPYPVGSEEAIWYDDQRQKAILPAAVNMAMTFAGLGLPMVERGAVGALGGRLSPASRAAEKGFLRYGHHATWWTYPCWD